MSFIQRRPGQDGTKSYKTMGGAKPRCGCCGMGPSRDQLLPGCQCRELTWHPGCTKCPKHCDCVEGPKLELRIRAPKLDPRRHLGIAKQQMVDLFGRPAKPGEEIEVNELTLRRIIQEEVGTAMKRLLASVRPPVPARVPVVQGGGLAHPAKTPKGDLCGRGLPGRAPHQKHRGGCPRPAAPKRIPGEVLAARLDRTCKRPGSEGLPEHAKHLGRSPCPAA